MAHVTLAMPETTRAALADLAAATGTTDLGQLCQDALRTYEWLLACQDAGQHIVALRPSDMVVLEQANALEGGREVLAPLRANHQES